MFGNVLPKIVPFMITWKNTVERAGHRWQYDARVFHAGYLRLQTDSEYVIFITFPLLQWFTNVPLCCVLCTLPALLHIVERTSRFIQLPTGRRQSRACFLLFSQYPKCDKMYIFSLDEKTTVFWPWRVFFKLYRKRKRKVCPLEIRTEFLYNYSYTSANEWPCWRIFRLTKIFRGFGLG